MRGRRVGMRGLDNLLCENALQHIKSLAITTRLFMLTAGKLDTSAVIVFATGKLDHIGSY